MTDHGLLAEKLFRQGYNCSQSVLLAFSDITGLDDATAAKLASSFGGGLGRMREVCGTVSAAAMILGLTKGYSDPTDTEAKKEHYKLVREFADRFKAQNGSIICRDLLSSVKTTVGGDPEARSAEYYSKRPCPELCKQAARILDEMLHDE